MSARPISSSECFASRVRDVFRSRAIRVLIALAALSVCVGLAILCWQVRDFLAGFVGMALVYFGLLFAWELLPFSEETRAKWAQEREWADRYMSYRWRNTLWIGLSMAAWRVWCARVDHKLDPEVLLLPAFLASVGVLAHGIWHLRKQTLH